MSSTALAQDTVETELQKQVAPTVWEFVQGTGKLLKNSAVVALGYSGFGVGKNNPLMQQVKSVGPIPLGKYHIGRPYTHKHLGPCVMDLTPLPGTNTFGRCLFRIHGDSKEHVGCASHGCIILGPHTRQALANSNSREIEVI